MRIRILGPSQQDRSRDMGQRWLFLAREPFLKTARSQSVVCDVRGACTWYNPSLACRELEFPSEMVLPSPERSSRDQSLGLPSFATSSKPGYREEILQHQVWSSMLRPTTCHLRTWYNRPFPGRSLTAIGSIELCSSSSSQECGKQANCPVEWTKLHWQ